MERITIPNEGESGTRSFSVSRGPDGDLRTVTVTVGHVSTDGNRVTVDVAFNVTNGHATISGVRPRDHNNDQIPLTQSHLATLPTATRDVTTIPDVTSAQNPFKWVTGAMHTGSEAATAFETRKEDLNDEQTHSIS